MRRGGEYDQRAKGDKMHHCRGYFSFVGCGGKYAPVSLYQLFVPVFIQVRQVITVMGDDYKVNVSGRECDSREVKHWFVESTT
jgi:hypothetical protein